MCVESPNYPRGKGYYQTARNVGEKVVNGPARKCVRAAELETSSGGVVDCSKATKETGENHRKKWLARENPSNRP